MSQRPHPARARRREQWTATRRVGLRSLLASVLLAVALPAIAFASAAPRHHGHRAHAARCAARRHVSHRRRAACLASGLRNAASSATSGLPVATITGGPPAGGVSSSANATFSFTMNRPHGFFDCSLDGAPYSQCSSPTIEQGLTNGAHSFSVYAVSDGITGQSASVAWSVGAPAAPPSAPNGVVATAGDGQVALTWNASASTAGVAAYRVFRDGGLLTQIATTSYTDTALSDGTTYGYTVDAVDASGNVSAMSNVVSATPQALPSTPTLVTPPATPGPTTPGPSVPAAASSGAYTSVTQASLPGTPWQGGGVQCAPRTASKSPRLRGTLSYTGGSYPSYLFSLPADSNLSTYPLEACDLVTAPKPLVLGAGGFYGIMVYVPRGWTIPNNSFAGVEIAEYHFQNVYGAPISLQLHPDHVTLALETGGVQQPRDELAGLRDPLER